MSYSTLEDAIHAAELFIEERYTTPIAKESAIKKLHQILDNEDLTDAEKIDKIKKIICVMFSKGQPWTIPILNMQFVYVEPGTFQMGANDGFEKENPVHSVTISNGYWFGKYTVTQDEYLSVTDNAPSWFKGGKKPVESVNWHEAVGFCQKLTDRERTVGRLPAGYEYRLPTEAEWEFAARGGTLSKGYTYSGSDNLDSVAWYDSNSGNVTHNVGTKSPNKLGIYDMSGNVWEWCQDDWHVNYVGAPSDGSRWGDGTSSSRVARGGSWHGTVRNCWVVDRGSNSPVSRRTSLGFRVTIASAR